MTSTATKAKREPGADRKYHDGDHDLTGRKLHRFKDPGPPIIVADYRPRIVHRDVEVRWQKAFELAGKDFGGPLVGDSVQGAPNSSRAAPGGC